MVYKTSGVFGANNSKTAHAKLWATQATLSLRSLWLNSGWLVGQTLQEEHMSHAFDKLFDSQHTVALEALSMRCTIGGESHPIGSPLLPACTGALQQLLPSAADSPSMPASHIILLTACYWSQTVIPSTVLLLCLLFIRYICQMAACVCSVDIAMLDMVLLMQLDLPNVTRHASQQVQTMRNAAKAIRASWYCPHCVCCSSVLMQKALRMTVCQLQARCIVHAGGLPQNYWKPACKQSTQLSTIESMLQCMMGSSVVQHWGWSQAALWCAEHCKKCAPSQSHG